jgi:cation:H+ antiporter
MQQYIYLIAGLILLIQGADWLLEGAASIAKRFRIHKLIIGLTIVAFGTSLPELFVTIAGSIVGTPDIIIGNLFGSNVANILLILGITSLIIPLVFHKSTIWKEIPFSFLAFAVLLLLSNKSFLGFPNELTPIDGLVLLLLFMVFIYYTSDMIIKKSEETIETRQEISLADPKFRNLYLISGSILIGITALYIGGKMTVDSAIIIAKNFGVSQFFISASVVAIGTSLPELFVSVRAALRKEIDLAIGNIIGSNIFNTLLVLGVALLIKPIAVSTTFIYDILIAMGVTFILFISMFIGQKHMLKRWQGIMFLLCYCAYIIYIIGR